MRILMIGASGTIGHTVREKLKDDHEIITASRNNGKVEVDITAADSIKSMFEKVEKVDAVVVSAGGAHMGPIGKIGEKEAYEGIGNKLMGQVNTVLTGQHYLKDGGSFTLTSGILSEDPIREGSMLSLVNGGINSFVKGAAVDFQKKGIRINAVSPGLVEDSADEMGDKFPGHIPVSMDKVSSGYVKCLEGGMTGEVIRVFE